MSTTTQEMVLDRIEALLKDQRYDLINNSEYGNTGRLQAVRPGALGSDVSVSYDFENGYCWFRRIYGKDVSCEAVDQNTTSMVHYTDAELLTCVYNVAAYLIRGDDKEST